MYQRCPRCFKIMPENRRIHWPCLLERARFVLLTLLVILGLIFVASFTCIGLTISLLDQYQSQRQTAPAPQSSIIDSAACPLMTADQWRADIPQ